MTVRPLKSTRLPDKLPRNRPCLPLSRCTNPLQGGRRGRREEGEEGEEREGEERQG